eukprot:6639985-Alexandrium_andersonii.AAC.1
MSASLVGSEMCIRDRPKPTHQRVFDSYAWERPSEIRLIGESRALDSTRTCNARRHSSELNT